ncbi:hypothetical protein BH11BAC3_BH11BAC3_41530 [soil metagenome]
MNKPLQQPLWENIQSFAIDDPHSSFPFSRKLARENNWTRSFTLTAIEEYRKFIYLCCTLPEGASPSPVIDKVWHLHLTYTTNYWVDFCEKTLSKKIHHHPSKGGDDEQNKHNTWYSDTLKHYTEIFESTPPKSIWSNENGETRIKDIEIYDTNYFNRITAAFIVLTIAYVLILNIYKSNGPNFLIHYFILIAAGIFISWILQQHKSDRLKQFIEFNFPEEFTTYQAGNFLYNEHRAYQAAIIDLLKRGIVDTDANKYILRSMDTLDPETEENPLLPNLIEKYAPGKTFSYLEGLDLVDNTKLTHASFEKLTRLSNLTDYQKFIIPGIIIAIGFARLFQGLANEKPVTYLLLEIGFFSLISLIIAAQYSYTYLVYQMAEQIWKQQNNNGYGGNVLNNFTLIGVAAVAGFAEYNALNNVFSNYTPVKKGLNDGSSSSGCSSSGCGSSCGSGCGGCGGD